MRYIFCKRNSSGSRSVEHIIPELLGEDEREDEVFELRGFLGAADAAGCVPDPPVKAAAAER
jgi:hypothetical protein